MLLARLAQASRRLWGALWAVALVGASYSLARPAAADTGNLIPAGQYLESFHHGARGLQSVPLPHSQQVQDGKRTDLDVRPSSEPEIWAQHFQRRRLQQSGLAVAPAAGIGFAALQATPPAATPPSSSTQLFTKSTNNSRLTALDSGALSGDSMKFIAPAPATANLSACNTLAYSDGYANVSMPAYQMIRFTANKGQCCDLCDADPKCVAWTRVAGGQANTRACYLMSDVGTVATLSIPPATAPAMALATAPGAAPAVAPAAAPAASVQLLAAGVATGGANGSWPLVQYTRAGQAVILEAGTKSASLFPDVMYGCPYPPSASGTCEPPPYCNCYNDVCYGSCQDDGGNGL